MNTMTPMKKRFTWFVAASALFLYGTAPAVAELKLQPAVATPAATKAMMLATARAGKRIVAVGDHGVVLLSDDDGAGRWGFGPWW